MKQLFFILIFFSLSANAQEKINFDERKLPDVMKTAQTQNKPVMLMGYADWCTHCNKMKTEVFTDAAVIDFYNKNFVCTWQNMESGDGMSLRKKYNIRAFPVFLYFDANGELLYSFSGEATAANFIKEGENARNEKMQFPYLKAQFESDVTNAENCLAYVSALRRSNLDTETAAEKYLSTQSDQQLVTNMNWKIIANGVRDLNSREFQYVLKNQQKFAAVSSQKRVDRKIINMVQEWLTPSVEATDTITYNKQRASAAKLGLFKIDSLIYHYDLKIYEAAKSWKNYREITANGVTNFSWGNASQLREISKVYMNNIHEPAAIDDAIGWSKRSLELNDSYETYLVISRLYFYRNDKKSAKEWAEKAKAVAIRYKFDTKQADEILNQLN